MSPKCADLGVRRKEKMQMGQRDSLRMEPVYFLTNTYSVWADCHLGAHEKNGH